MEKNSVGYRLKTIRQSQNITMEDLAARTGLNLEFLASLEDNEQYPSLGPLLKVARALGIRLGTLLDDHISEDPLVVRKGDRVRQVTTHRGRQGEVSFYSLGRGKNDRHMEPFFIDLKPYDSNEAKKLSTHEGEEFIVVVSGKMELIYGPDTHIIEPGDSVYFNSCLPHHVGAAGDEPAEIYAVIYFPE